MATRILLVDDEPNLLECLTYALESHGFEVIQATNGLEALGAARVQQPDLVLLDVMLPGENGYRVARTLREDQERGVYPESMPILLMTARDLRSDPARESMFNQFSRADAVIYKPFDIDVLIGCVEKVLRGEPLEDPNAGPGTESSAACMGLSQSMLMEAKPVVDELLRWLDRDSLPSCPTSQES